MYNVHIGTMYFVIKDNFLFENPCLLNHGFKIFLSQEFYRISVEGV